MLCSSLTKSDTMGAYWALMGRSWVYCNTTALLTLAAELELCSAWQERGFSVTGIDPEQKMIDIAKRSSPSSSFLKASVLERLPFGDKSFDIAIASYVAHGLKRHERELMYKEMSRLAKHLVIIHDFNSRRSWLIDLIETLEGGDYFGFIESARDEIRDNFGDVKFIEVGPRAVWYIGSPM